jgi:FemAB-related protein (PEP-CTERM system-associated)
MSKDAEKIISLLEPIETIHDESETLAADASVRGIVVSDSPDESYADFVQSMPDARLCHLPKWSKMVESLFSHKGHYLVAHENGTICGVLPLTQIRSRLFGNRMVSQPFSDYGGPLVKKPAALDALYQRAVALATEYGCESIEFRSTFALPYNLHLRNDKISMYLPLASDAEEVWKGLRPQIRNRIRKAEKSGITVINGHRELLDEFYRVWTIRMHQLGTPCYPRKLFNGIMDTFADNSRIFLAVKDGMTIAVLFVYTFNSCVHTRWGCALREYDTVDPNYILNWSAIEFYCARAMLRFDFGRSTVGSGQHTFKERWGTKPIQLFWQYWTRPDGKLRVASPDDPKYRKKVKMWQRLPLWLTRLVGPHISRNLP